MKNYACAHAYGWLSISAGRQSQMLPFLLRSAGRTLAAMPIFARLHGTVTSNGQNLCSSSGSWVIYQTGLPTLRSTPDPHPGTTTTTSRQGLQAASAL